MIKAVAVRGIIAEEGRESEKYDEVRKNICVGKTWSGGERKSDDNGFKRKRWSCRKRKMGSLVK